MECAYFDRQQCRSCGLMGMPYPSQLERKAARVAQTLADVVPTYAWRLPFPSPETGFRNKVKLAVGGTVQSPTLGITDASGRAVDLRECGIVEPALWEIIPDLGGFITYAGLRPYDVARRDGDLKFIIATTNSDGELMIRFVLRDPALVEPLRRALPALRERLPQLRVISANIHPEHKAVIEGDVEIPLSDESDLPMHLATRTLHLRHRSFFQTNTAVAQGLYSQAVEWAKALPARAVLDLYCGVGGFALHLAAPGRRVHGVETAPDAVASARTSVAQLEPDVRDAVTFEVADATAVTGLVDNGRFDLVVVNPPRRGIEGLAAALETSRIPAVLYSSCNPDSLARDLAAMPSYTVQHARLFDMFPQSEHAEVMVLLTR